MLSLTPLQLADLERDTAPAVARMMVAAALVEAGRADAATLAELVDAATQTQAAVRVLRRSLRATAIERN